MAIAHSAQHTAQGAGFLSAALSYATDGIPVFPLKPRGKTPLTEHGFKDATTDEKIIRNWWRRWPQANIGIPTGEASGFDVLDVDPRHGGEDSLFRLTNFRGEGRCITFPRTKMAQSGGGGDHILFAHRPGVPIINAAGVPGYPGLDVRTTGGYIVAAPSVHESGRAYAWINPEDELAEMPNWLVNVLVRPERQNSAQQSRGKSNLISDGQDTGQYWLERFLADAYEGNRNSKGFGLACQLRDEGLSETEASDYMMAYAARVPGSGYTEHEALASLRSAYSAPPRERARALVLQSVPSPRPPEIKFDFPEPDVQEGHEACSRKIAELEAKLQAKDAEVERLKGIIVRMNQHEKERQDIAAAKMNPATKLVAMDAINHLDREHGNFAEYPIENGAAVRLNMAAGTVRNHLEKAAAAGVFEKTVQPTGRDKEKVTVIRPGPILLEQRRLREIETEASRAGGKREGAGRKPSKPGVCGACESLDVQTNTITKKTARVMIEYTTIDQTCRSCGTREIVDGGSREISSEVLSEIKFDSVEAAAEANQNCPVIAVPSLYSNLIPSFPSLQSQEAG